MGIITRKFGIIARWITILFFALIASWCSSVPLQAAWGLASHDAGTPMNATVYVLVIGAWLLIAGISFSWLFSRIGRRRG